MATWAILYNPTAGSFRPRKLEAIQQALRGQGVATRLLATQWPGHATELARTVGGVERLAVYGGDGTLSQAAAGVLGRPLPLLFLPGGTANVMAIELELPMDPVQAALAGLTAQPRAVRPGRVNERLFLLMAGFGFDGEVVHGVNLRLKAWSGKGAYVWSGLKAALHAHPLLRASLNGDGTLEGQWLVVARAAHYAGAFRMHPQAGLLRDRLGLVMVRQRWWVPFLVAHLGLNLHRERPGVALRSLTHGRLECDVPVHVQVDGDYYTRGRSFELGLAPETVQLCFPAAPAPPAAGPGAQEREERA
jgi:diacylglycerol kinase (ATP)